MYSPSKLRIFADYAQWVTEREETPREEPTEKTPKEPREKTRRIKKRSIKEPDWICLFCEYEKMYGTKPKYFIFHEALRN